MLIPVYRETGGLLAEQHELPGFEVTEAEFELLQRYVGYLGDERVLLAQYEAEPQSFIVGWPQRPLSDSAFIVYR